MYCPRCGTENQDNNYQCTQCGEILHATPVQQVVVTSDETLGGMIPMDNGAAVAAYYLGVFSVIPFIGIALGIPGLILGVKGLRKANEHPEVKGKAHAWVGIICGGFFGLGYLILAAALVYSGMRG